MNIDHGMKQIEAEYDQTVVGALEKEPINDHTECLIEENNIE